MLPESYPISKIIAVSGVATDRFPSRMTLRGRTRSTTAYRYIGPRTDNNLVSRGQSINQIAASILESPNQIEARVNILKKIFSTLKISNGIVFEFHKSSPKVGVNWTLKRISEAMASSRLFGRQMDDTEKENLHLRCLKLILSKGEIELRLDLDDTDCVDASTPDLEALKFLLNSGIISVNNSYTTTENHDKILPLSEFSSGQWHMLSSLLFTAISVENNTLIVVDEPENSLHPAWQQQYLGLMSAMISSATGVHVMVATHSPLVAASLDAENAEVIQLKTDIRGRITASLLKGGPYGWTSDEILQEVFGLESSRSVQFTNEMDVALSLFAEGNRNNLMLKRTVRSLRKTLPNLPEDDVVRQIIQTLSIVLDAGSGGE